MGDHLDKDYCDIFNNLNKTIDPNVCYRCNYEVRKNNPIYKLLPKSQRFIEYEKQQEQSQSQGLSTSDSLPLSFYALQVLFWMLGAIHIFFWFAAVKATDYNIDNNENEKMYPGIKSIGIALYVLNSITLILFVPLCYYIYKAYKNTLDTKYLAFIFVLLLFYCVEIVLVTMDQRIIKIFD